MEETKTNTINTPAGQPVGRERMVAYLNTGTSGEPVWSAFGKRVSSSSMNYDWSKSTNRDILGNVYTDIKAPIITQSFDPVSVDSGDAAVVKVWEMAIRDQDRFALANQKVLVAHFYSGDEGKNFAEVHDTSTIVVSRSGGDGGDNLTIAIEVTYGGDRTVGTVAKGADGVTFTPTAAA